MCLIFWLALSRASKTLHVVFKELFLQSRQQLGTDTKNVGINYSSVCASELLVDQGFVDQGICEMMVQCQEYVKRGICGISDTRFGFILGNFQNPYEKQLHVSLQGKKVIQAREIHWAANMR